LPCPYSIVSHLNHSMHTCTYYGGKVCYPNLFCITQ
jgi:hypothetical protein